MEQPIHKYKKSMFFAVWADETFASSILMVRTTKFMKIFLDVLNQDKFMLYTLLSKFWKIYGVVD